VHDARIDCNAPRDPGGARTLGPIDGRGGLFECCGEVARLGRRDILEDLERADDFRCNGCGAFAGVSVSAMRALGVRGEFKP
jgi:hypothetical protein